MNMSSGAPEVIRAEKVPDDRRVQRILDELSGKSDPKGTPTRQSAIMDGKAKDMLMEYAFELTSSIIESSSALTKHRGSQIVEADDVNLILAKKLGIELPGQSRIKSLHQHNLKSLPVPTAATGAASSSKETIPTAATESTRKQGTKRKANN